MQAKSSSCVEREWSLMTNQKYPDVAQVKKLWEAPNKAKLKKNCEIAREKNWCRPSKVAMKVNLEDGSKLSNYTKVVIDDLQRSNFSIVGDSDDETDDGEIKVEDDDNAENIQRPVNSNTVRLERIVNAFQSKASNERLKVIGTLKTCIAGILDEDIVEDLRFPPPYDVNTITLTHNANSAVISDLEKNNPQWSQWVRTQEPLGSQFPKPFDEDPDSNAIAIDTNSRKKKLQRILDVCGLALFRCFDDSSEKVRLGAIECVQMLCLGGIDLGKHISYLITSITARYSQSIFDADLNVFVDDILDHEFYKRGGATERQDKKSLISTNSLAVIEKSEEIRLALCILFRNIIRCCLTCKSSSLLNAYFSDIVLALQKNIRDTYPELQIASMQLLVQIMRIPQWEIGAKYYSLAIARASIVNLRHRNSKVRVAAIELLEASVCVPDREKIKGAGTEAIVDLVGFKEENVLPVAAFYRAESGVIINTLAEIISDKNSNVRRRCCQMLSYFVLCLPDRYDHHLRLLPYLLSFLKDDNEKTRNEAMIAIDQCGQQYEAEHSEDIIERRQYGVDGDKRCNYASPLPHPFLCRPRIGTRLFVRNNSKRLLSAVIEELSSWNCNTREQSAKLFSTLVVYCEEHLTMEFDKILHKITYAIKFIQREACTAQDRAYHQQLKGILELMGRYVDPDVYVDLLLPRICGDVENASTFCEGGYHSEISRVSNTTALRCMMTGSLSNRLIEHIPSILNTLTSNDTLGPMVGNSIKSECLDTLISLFKKLKHDGQLLNSMAVSLCDSCKKVLTQVRENDKCDHLVVLAQEASNILDDVLLFR